jgi:hypothetical protein
MSRLAAGVCLALACAGQTLCSTRPAHATRLALAGDAFRVTCRVPDDPAARMFVLEPAGGTWRLVFSSAEINASPVRLALPNARPTVTATTARLLYHNANGGRHVDLSVGDGPSRLDVWVDHGLEVNIEPDLDPRVDLMSTHGPLEGVRCDITPAAP